MYDIYFDDDLNSTASRPSFWYKAIGSYFLDTPVNHTIPKCILDGA